MTNEFRPVLKSLTEQVYEHLRSQIESDQYAPGSLIPSEKELQVIYGVSRATIRESVSQLVAAGLLRRERGRGTFVQAPPIDEAIQTVTSFAEEVRRQGRVPTSHVLSCAAKPPPPHVRERLQLSPGQLVTLLERLRLVDGEPVSLARDYVPVHLAPGLSSESVVDDSLYRGLEKHFGMRLVIAEDEVESVIPAPAESRLLGMRPGGPVLFLRRVTFGSGPASRDLMPVHYAENNYRGDRFRYIARREGRTRYNSKNGASEKGGDGSLITWHSHDDVGHGG